MEKLYCTIFVVDISHNPEDVETVTSRVQQLIEDHGGVIKKINRWGKRRLAYPIKKKTHGYYVEIEFTANSRLNIPATLEQEYRLNDRVLRYLTYIVDKKELIQRARLEGKGATQAQAPKAEPEKPAKAEPKEAVKPEAAREETVAGEPAKEQAGEEKSEEKQS
ncbi:MAG: 30S ribosomal protein S6 [Calditrichaeota bacterium]|nr:MAG: 30S ribosomal protein S6 [Calditrichota bacterium]